MIRMDTTVQSYIQTEWESSLHEPERIASMSTDQLLLAGFLQQLASVVSDADAGIAAEKEVQREAELLMSLSRCTEVPGLSHGGRATPETASSVESASLSSTSSSQSRRNSFKFSCPSFSLKPRHRATCDDQNGSPSPLPSDLLNQSLRCSDRDGMRLSSEAMALNIIQSFAKAIEWRIDAWIGTLCKSLLHREESLINQKASQETLEGLKESNEAKLVVCLRRLKEEVRIVDVGTGFKVLGRVNDAKASSEPPLKKQRLGDESIGDQPEEGDYTYNVVHDIAMLSDLNVHTPAGNVHIAMEVPGTVTGTFFSSEGGSVEMNEVLITVNTDILAAMMEKSCREAVRESVAALLDSRPQEAPKAPTASKAKQPTKKKSSSQKRPPPASTPVRTVSLERVTHATNIVTPRDASSPAVCSDSDPEDKPLILPIPSNFDNPDGPSSLKMIKPLAQARTSGDLPTTWLSAKKTPLPSLVSPPPGTKPAMEVTGEGPNLPTLVEVACAAIHDN